MYLLNHLLQTVLLPGLGDWHWWRDHHQARVGGAQWDGWGLVWAWFTQAGVGGTFITSTCHGGCSS